MGLDGEFDDRQCEQSKGAKNTTLLSPAAAAMAVRSWTPSCRPEMNEPQHRFHDSSIDISFMAFMRGSRRLEKKKKPIHSRN